MSEPMTVRVEAWPVAADDTGVWLVSCQDAWRNSLPVTADNEPHAEVELLLAGHGVRDDVVLVHSTSWRPDDTSVMVTYMAVLYRPGLVLDHWPNALPISLSMAEGVGRPPTHGPVDPPVPRYVDVLMHGLRHLKFLIDTDATAATVLAEPWPTHLAALEPALAVMYDQAHR